jgi:hypothetical protein
MRRLLLPSIVLVLAVAGGCARRAAPPMRLTPPKPAAKASLEDAKSTALKYVKSLQAEQYAAAHALLSAESKKKHPLDQFEAQAKQGISSYDLSRTTVKEGGDGKAVVAIHLEEDPAAHAFVLVREKNEWRVVYDTGRPWAPYAE